MISLKNLAPARFERAIFGLGNHCSILLSYEANTCILTQKRRKYFLRFSVLNRLSTILIIHQIKTMQLPTMQIKSTECYNAKMLGYKCLLHVHVVHQYSTPELVQELFRKPESQHRPTQRQQQIL